ncbi:MAG: LysM peptidoglycan-binding domain-containing protein [Chloroflexota bacterium]|nr:LysM peptidoglycan-binding domain-containing protein [Chloroflexota bacterium]
MQKNWVLGASLWCLALLGPILYVAGIVTKGLGILNLQYARLGLTYIVLALSAGCAAYLTFRHGQPAWRLVAGVALLINLGSVTASGVFWLRSTHRAIAEIKNSRVEAGRVGVLVAPVDQSPEAAREARAIEDRIANLLALMDLDAYTTVRYVPHPFMSVAQAKAWGESMGGHVVVWGPGSETGGTDAAYSITVLSGNQTDIALDPLSLMLLMVTEDTLVLSAEEASQEEVFATEVVAPLSTGFACLAVGRPGLAAGQFDRVMSGDLFPEDDLPTLHNHFGAVLLRLDRPDLALKEYESSNDLEPNARAWIGIGLVRIAQREWPSAAKAFSRAVALDPYDPAAYCGLGIVYAGHHDVERALSSYEQAIALAPDEAVPYALSALTYELVGEIAAARDAYRRCVVHAGSHAGLYAAAEERATYILAHPPTAVPTATPPPVPTPSPIPTRYVYSVERGDTLQLIANEFGVSVQDLVVLNELDNPNALSVGQVLLIPQKASD